MIQKASDTSAGADKIKWLGASLFLGLGVATNYIILEQALWLRVLVIAAFFMLALILGLWTKKGFLFVSFAKEARSEVRKVVWPTRQETMQITGIVLAVVVVIGLLLWGIDAVLLHTVAWLTGLGAK